MLYFTIGEIIPCSDKAPEAGRGSIFSLLRSPLICVSIFLITLGACASCFIAPTLSLHLLEFNLTPMEISLFYVIAPLIHATLAPFWGYLSDKKMTTKFAHSSRPTAVLNELHSYSAAHSHMLSSLLVFLPAFPSSTLHNIMDLRTLNDET
ncbi:MFS-type transporter slc18b1-like [Plakobranchus ocellatus]|uniref:MFS-type transporter slc18b1-like n=1 Tax=Plakobranchus ocellatus TaxID=259542 RepID=A0AAV4B118_9GAST|nr:MFS-type transporter slc18b1-like [Plakobranchus ocellatus]